jgi:hypothetical protein
LAHQERKEAQRASCITCHGKGRELMFDNWIEGSKKLNAELPGFLTSLRSSAMSVAGKNDAVKTAVANAEKNFNLIRDGHASHNVWYALHLVASSREQVQTAVSSVKKGFTAPEIPASAKKENSCLTFCHGKSIPETVNYAGKSLPHLMHVTDLELGCQNCHSIAEHGKTEINKEACAACHESM